MSRDDPRPAVGHMPFPGHRTQAEIMAFETAAAEDHLLITGSPAPAGYIDMLPRNQMLTDERNSLVGKWARG